MNHEIRFTRRQLLRTSASTLLAAGLWPGSLCSRDQDHGSDFTFLVVNDLHYLNDKGEPWFGAVIRQMKESAPKIDFCLVVGDLSEHGQARQLEPVRDLLKGLGFPFFSAIGNHDHRAPNDRRPYEATFPKSLNASWTHQGWQMLGLDTSEGMRTKVTVQAPTLQWLDATLPKLDKRRPTLIYTHFPLGPFVPYRISNADDVLARFKEFNLQAAFNGHFHGFTERKAGATTLTTNRCCSFYRKNHDGTKEKGFFVCRAKEGKIKRSFVEVKSA